MSKNTEGHMAVLMGIIEILDGATHPMGKEIALEKLRMAAADFMPSDPDAAEEMFTYANNLEKTAIPKYPPVET